MGRFVFCALFYVLTSAIPLWAFPGEDPVSREDIHIFIHDAKAKLTTLGYDDIALHTYVVWPSRDRECANRTDGIIYFRVAKPAASEDERDYKNIAWEFKTQKIRRLIKRQCQTQLVHLPRQNVNIHEIIGTQALDEKKGFERNKVQVKDIFSLVNDTYPDFPWSRTWEVQLQIILNPNDWDHVYYVLRGHCSKDAPAIEIYVDVEGESPDRVGRFGAINFDISPEKSQKLCDNQLR